jgi:hypothetical protein
MAGSSGKELVLLVSRTRFESLLVFGSGISFKVSDNGTIGISLLIWKGPENIMVPGKKNIFLLKLSNFLFIYVDMV